MKFRFWWLRKRVAHGPTHEEVPSPLGKGLGQSVGRIPDREGVVVHPEIGEGILEVVEAFLDVHQSAFQCTMCILLLAVPMLTGGVASLFMNLSLDPEKYIQQIS